MNAPSDEKAAETLTPCVWRLASPIATGAASGLGHALAVVELRGEIEQAFASLDLKSVAVGSVQLRHLRGVDELLVARFDAQTAFVFPHGGSEVLRTLIERLASVRIDREHANSAAARLRFPEAEDEVEAQMLHALGAAPSPLAIDLLLSQPSKWRAHAAGRLPRMDPAHSAALDWLLIPPTVIAIGPPNIGKSSLLNALAKQTVAIVADAAGTTRDHIGVSLNLAGLAVRYIDSPGWEIAHSLNRDTASAEAAIQTEAQETAHRLAANADLVLSCGDPRTGFLPADLLDGLHPRVGVLRVLLRSDLGPPPARTQAIDCAVSVMQREGLEGLVDMIRERLVPQSALGDPGAWPFWETAESPHFHP